MTVQPLAAQVTVEEIAAAAGGVIQAAQTEWYLRGVDLVETMSEGLDVLEHGTGWAQAERKA